MSDTKFTPGPWTMETVRTSCGTCHKIGPFPRPDYASTSEGWACVYDDYPPGIGSPDLLANARLIASAPDLYAALQRSAEGWANAIELDIIPPRTQPSAAILRDEARAALAKARGETP